MGASIGKLRPLIILLLKLVCVVALPNIQAQTNDTTLESSLKSHSLEQLKVKAENGDAKAQQALGFRYYKGEGLGKDLAVAAKWYRKAAEGKLAVAQNNLGILYLNGKGVERNVAEAFKLFEQAANQGDGWGLNNLGGMYEMGWGVAKDRTKAASFYKQAAEKGIESAQANLVRLTPGAAPAAPVTLN